jgi:quercetin dioxygenase-like cupin family protein
MTAHDEGGLTLVATKHTYVRTHAISGNVLTFDLKSNQADLMERARTAKAGRTAKTLVKEGPLRITLVALKQGISLKEHQVAGVVSIQALRGRVAVEADGSRFDMRPGQLLVLDADIRHRATAMTDCAILITMSIN